MLGDLTVQDCKTLATFARGLTFDEAKTLLDSMNRTYLLKNVYPGTRTKLQFRHLPHSVLAGTAKLDASGFIAFRGGPTKGAWYHGTALTFVVDCLFNSTVDRGSDYVNKCIHKFFMIGAP